MRSRALEPPSSAPRVEWSCHHETTAVRYKATNQLCCQIWTRSFKSLECFMQRPSRSVCAGGWPGATKPGCSGKERGLQGGVGPSCPSSPRSLGTRWPLPPPPHQGPGPGAAISSLNLHPEAPPPQPWVCSPALPWLWDPGQTDHQLPRPAGSEAYASVTTSPHCHGHPLSALDHPELC